MEQQISKSAELNSKVYDHLFIELIHFRIFVLKNWWKVFKKWADEHAMTKMTWENYLKDHTFVCWLIVSRFFEPIF